MLWQDLEDVLRIKCQLVKDRPIVVGVSGGPDSLCLLHALHTAGYSVIAAHVNHQLRPEASTEADIVKQFASSLGIPFESILIDVKSFAVQEKLSVEESARLLRYRFLMQTSMKYQAQALAVAHQADDQIETVLMHMLRGSGLSGLKGMPFLGFVPVFSTDIPIVRPLLGFWREQILEYCQKNGINPCYDATNEDITYFRNRIRHELVPLLTTYNTQAPQHLWQLSQLVGADDRLLEQLSVQAENEIVSNGNGFTIINQKSFLFLDIALQRRLIRSLIAHIHKDIRDIPFSTVDKCLAFFTSNSTAGICQLLEDVWLSRFSATEICLYQSNADFSSLFPILTRATEVELVIPGETEINPYWKIHSEFVDKSTVNFASGEEIAYIDLDQCQGTLILCKAKTSNRVGFVGAGNHSIKMGDLFTNKKVFKPIRSSWPVLKFGEMIFWVVGLKRSNLALVDNRSTKILKLSLAKKNQLSE